MRGYLNATTRANHYGQPMRSSQLYFIGPYSLAQNRKIKTFLLINHCYSNKSIKIVSLQNVGMQTSYMIFLHLSFDNLSKLLLPPLLGGYQSLVQSQLGFQAVLMQRIAWVSLEVILKMIFKFQGM